MSDSSTKPDLSDYDDVGAEGELAEGRMKGVDVAGERVLIARVDSCLHAIGGLCSHQIAYLEDGVLTGKVVECPRHGAGFDLTTGEPTCPPADMPVPVYAIQAAGGRLWVSRRPVR